MDRLTLHESTRAQLEIAHVKPSHGYLFFGPMGLGKTSAAREFAASLVGVKANAGDRSRFIMQITPEDGKQISVKQTAGIAGFIAAIKPSHVAKKVVIIDQADKLSLEAANSLLLTLEEPTKDTVIILVADNKDSVLPTIRSRLQAISFRHPAQSAINELIHRAKLDSKFASSVGPLPALLLRKDPRLLLDYTELDSLREKFMSGGIKERLLVASAVIDKSQAMSLVDLLSSAVAAQNEASAAWLGRAQALILARLHLYNNGNPKFVIEKLALDF